MRLKIEHPKIVDCLQIKIIAIKCLPQDITSYVPFLHLIQSIFKENLVARMEKKVVGFISTLNVFSNETALLLQFAVLPEYRGKGIGKGLMNNILRLLKRNGYKKVCLRVDVKNKKAIKLYERIGFKKKKKIFFKRRFLMEYTL